MSSPPRDRTAWQDELARIVGRLTSPFRLRFFATACLTIWLAGLVLRLMATEGIVEDNHEVVGRDFIAFYTAGRLIREGEGPRLYRLLVQQRAQERLLAPEVRPGTGYFAYPAFMAVAYAPLASLPYRAAFYVHSVGLALAVGLGAFLLRRRLRALAPHWLLAAALTLAWFPMFHSVIGGQNTAITFALLAAIYVGTAERRPWLAGVALGLLTFKPQYALPVGLVLLARRQYASAAIAAGVALLLYLVAAVYCGWDWPARLREGMWMFAAQERGANGPILMSVVEVLDFALVQRLRLSRWAHLATAVSVAGWLVVAALVVHLLAAGRRIAAGGERYAVYWALLVATLLLVSPHVAYYDSALLALAVILLLDYLLVSRGAVPTAVRISLVAGFFSYAAALGARAIGFQPLIALSLAVLLWAASLLRESGGLAAAPLTRPIAPPPPA